MTKQLSVLIDGAEIGQVTQDLRGKFNFTYGNAYRQTSTAIPLSISMPLPVAEHDDKAVRPFLWGLLPDNDDTLNSWGRRFGVNPRNPFALLSEVGEDLQGAIQMAPPEKLGELKKREGVTPLSRDVLKERFAALIRDPGAIQFAPGGGQFSLAGAQRKKALYLVNGRWYEPRGRTPLDAHPEAAHYRTCWTSGERDVLHAAFAAPRSPCPKMLGRDLRRHPRRCDRAL